MKILVPVKRVVDYNVKVRVKSDGTGVDIVNVKMSMNPFDEIADRGGGAPEGKGRRRPRVDGRLDAASRNARKRCARRWRSAPTAPSSIESSAELQPLAVAKILKALVDKEQPRPRHPRQAGHRRRLPTRPARCWPRSPACRRRPSRAKVEVSELTRSSVVVTREVDGGHRDGCTLRLPAVVTTDLRLNEPRYVTLPNIMKAKKKPLDTFKAGRSSAWTTARASRP